MDELTKARMVMAALNAGITPANGPEGTCFPVAATVEQHRVLRELRMTTMYWATPADALIAAAEALGLEPVPLVEPGMVQIPLDVLSLGYSMVEGVALQWALRAGQTQHKVDKQMHAQWVAFADAIRAALSGTATQGAPSKTDASAPALAILDRWLENMDHPEETKPLEIHHTDIAILRAAITGAPVIQNHADVDPSQQVPHYTPAPKEGS